MQDARQRGSSRKHGRFRQIVAWVAVLCVYVQLVAVSVCAAGDPANAFPICHAHNDAGNGHTPTLPDHRCPFCAAHCHATAALAPAHAARLTIVASAAERPVPAIRSIPRVVAGVSARGPPVAA